MSEYSIDYLSPTQREFLQAAAKYVFFGGARGGGKSFVVRVAAALYCFKYPGITCMIVRKTYPELQENHIVPLTRDLHCYAPEKAQRLAQYNDLKDIMSAMMLINHSAWQAITIRRRL